MSQAANISHPDTLLRLVANHQAHRVAVISNGLCPHDLVTERTLRAAWVTIVFVIALASCTRHQESTNRPDMVVPPSDDASDRTDTKPVGPHEWKCPDNAQGSPMVLISDGAGRPFCIDARLASYGDYALFVAAKGEDFGGQPQECHWNDNWGPVTHDPKRTWAQGYDPYCGPPPERMPPDQVLRCVDFCDAWAFCSWSGKRLCGLRGAEPGKLTIVDSGGENMDVYRNHKEAALSQKSELFAVCTQGGTTKFPYGDQYYLGACEECRNGYLAPNEAFLDHNVNLQKCGGTISPYDQVYNLMGASYQWANICTDSSHCLVYGSCSPDRTCEQAYGGKGAQLDNPTYNVRCCADAVEVVEDM